ncbi:hypothetical protein ICJ83_01005 [Aestuariibaculum sp. TT11]|uniref:POTRA domain-containing protein n=1 Tax=Aestuariibaculum sediminum TaxID=2770637 RepID=A0A8J6U6C2_9FLAO|nr:hypothetical protein [Aestuariibaculum sediminum]
MSQNLHLTITGRTKYETSVIDSLNYLKKHPNFIALKNEVDSIQKKLNLQGYIENTHNDILKENDSTFSTVFQLKNKYHRLYIYYKESDINKSILKKISQHVHPDYFVIDFSTVEKTLNYINQNQTESGFPFSKLRLTKVVVRDETSLQAELKTFTDSKKRSIDNIIIKGYEKFPESYLKHYLKIKTNRTFNLSEIKKKTARLKNLRFTNETKPPEVLFTKDSTTLYLYLEKTKSNTFDGFLGFGTNEDSNKLQFDGYLNLNLINNLNFGETLRLLYKSDENEQQTFEANTSLPYLFKSPIGFDFLLRIFRKDSSFTTVNQSAKLHYQINPKHKIFSGITFTESNNLLSENNISTLTDYRTNYFTIAYEFINSQSNSALFPVQSKYYLETNFGNRTQNNTKEQQSLFNLETFKIFNFNYRNCIYLRLTGSLLNSNNYLENELMRFGGINSIRGFEENSIYASLFSVLNTEYRYQLSNSIYIHSVTDLAYYQNKITESNEKLYSFGFGMAIITKTGLLRLTYANGKTENTPFKFSNSKIHISLNANF